MKIGKRAKREAKQLLGMCRVNGVLDEARVRRVVQHLIDARRRSSSAILAQFRRLVRLDLARRTAIVESATPLAADLQAAVEANLARRYGPGLAIAYAHRPALIGGMCIRMGNDVYDGSVRAGLEDLARRFS
jgi:F-type H+-transporting ATPase subunit delta